MPNRYIRESAIESDAVNSLNWQTEVFYRRLLNRVDDFGRYTAHPSLLRASIFPLQLNKVRDSDMSRLLAECEKAGLLFVYSTNGKPQLVLNKWEKGRAINSQYDPPPIEVCERMKTFVYKRKHPSVDAPDSDSDSDTDDDSDTDVGKPKAAPAAPTSDADWLASLASDSTYAGIDVSREYGKMTAWCKAHRKEPTRRRFVNWLNRVDKPMTGTFALMR